MSVLAKRLIYVIGFLLTGVSLAFVVVSLMQNAEEIDFSNLSPSTITALALLSVGYGLINILLALAWCELLHHFKQPVERLWAVRAYGVSQIAKYIPSNMVHMAGRQAIGAADGLPNWPLAKSIMWETGVIIIMALPFVFLPLSLVLDIFAWLAPSILLFGGSTLTIMWLARQLFSVHLSRATLMHTTFLIGSSLIFAAIIVLTMPNMIKPDTLIASCGAYVIAWLAGLITPGAPAGIGVREVVLYGLLHTVISQADLLMVIALGRLVTVGGDLLFFGAALIIPFFRLRMRSILGLPHPNHID